MRNLLTLFFVKFIETHKEQVHTFIKESFIPPKRNASRSIARYSLPIQTDSTPAPSAPQNTNKQDVFDKDFVLKTLNFCISNQIQPNELSKVINSTFVDKLLFYIDQKGMREPEVYKAAQIDRRLFSKIISNKDYRPSKDTALALAFALNLSLVETNDFLERAGYTLSHSIKRDIILEYFICEKIYNLNKINAFLYYANEKIIGRNV